MLQVVDNCYRIEDNIHIINTTSTMSYIRVKFTIVSPRLPPRLGGGGEGFRQLEVEPGLLNPINTCYGSLLYSLVQSVD